MKHSNPNRTVSPPALFLALLSTLSCATGSGGGTETATGTRYPQRASGCELAIYHTPVPGVPSWDDLGIAEANCHISSTTVECMRMLKADACRMGGDVIYNVPRKPYRPRDQVIQFRGQVAHTRSGAPKKEEDPNLPPAASPEESSAPVVPLPSANAAEPVVPLPAAPPAAAP